MELIQVGAKTYYLKNATNIGVYKVDDHNVYLIDSGNDADTGKKILKIMDAQGWHVQGIINTHSHADHIGGNQLIQARTNCTIYAAGVEKCLTEYPLLEPVMLYGGMPLATLQNKFLLARPSHVTTINNNLPDGLMTLALPGHAMAMIGVRTDDNVVFLGDAIFNEHTITKYHLCYLYHVEEFLQTLDILEKCVATLFIPSHCEATTDIKHLLQINRQKVNEISNFIYQCCAQPITYENILQHIFEHYHLTMDANQYVLVGSTVRSYLSYLCNLKKIAYTFNNHQMFWQQCK